VSTYFLLRSRQIRFFVVCLSKKGLLLLTVKCLAEIKFVLQYGSVCEAKNIRKNERLRERVWVGRWLDMVGMYELDFTRVREKGFLPQVSKCSMVEILFWFHCFKGKDIFLLVSDYSWLLRSEKKSNNMLLRCITWNGEWKCWSFKVSDMCRSGMHNVRPAGQMWPTKGFNLARKTPNCV